jgi:hypothetical protein
METIKFLMDNILLWIVISIFVLRSVMMGDPGSSDLSNIIPTVICGLIITNNNNYNNTKYSIIYINRNKI